MKSSRTLVFRGTLPWPLRLVALLLIPVHVATAMPVVVSTAAIAPVAKRQESQQPPAAAFAQQILLQKPKPPTVPKFAVPSREQRLSAEPTDRELMLLRGLGQMLLPLAGEQQKGENAALGKALSIYLRDSKSVKPLNDFLIARPQSRWKPALLINLGLHYRAEGRLSKAKLSFEECWKLSKAEPAGALKLLADRAVGELAEVCTDLREFKQLDALIKELESRDVRGSGTARVSDARTRKDFLMSLPLEKRYRCGPLAVRELFRFLHPGEPLPKGRGKVEITEQGAKLSDLAIYAKAHGMDYQIAFRSPGASVLYPSIVHWKAGHYTWLKQVVEEGYLSREATFGGETNVSVTVLDEEATGYCLVPAGKLPPGWRQVTSDEARNVIGSGQSTPGGDPLPPCNITTAKPCPKGNCKGMADYNMDLHSVALMLMDTPIGYQPPVGPLVEFSTSYHSREVVDMSTLSNLGSKWAFNWLCYVKDSSSTMTRRYGPSGGSLDYFTGNMWGSYFSQRMAHDRLVKISPTVYELYRLDGGKEVFDLAEPGSAPRVFRTKIIDPQGNVITFGYDANYRIRTVTDALGKVTVVDYELTTDPVNPDFFKITKVTDPFGRYATFQYNAYGQLWKITDTIGVTSEFTYGSGDFVVGLTTPYGKTVFSTAEDASRRVIEVTDPAGAKERVEWLATSNLPDKEAVAPAGFVNEYMSYRNAYYWDKKAMSERPGDYSAARITHFLHSAEYWLSYWVESTKAPLENRVWNMYPYLPGQTNFEPSVSVGQSGGGGGGMTGPLNDSPMNLPTRVARILDDGSEQKIDYTWNSFGNVASVTDPLGRVTNYDYDAGGVNLTRVRQKTGTDTYDILFAADYNAQHRPQTATDAAGQTTSYTYNSVGQVRTVTNAKNETTTFWYHPTGNPNDSTAPYNPEASLDPAAAGYLVKIEGPVVGANVSFTYDGFGRVRTATDSQGYTVTTDYDAFDRPSKVTYPDGTYEQILYRRLDSEWLRDRLGRWTHQLHDANRHLVASIDSNYGKTSYDWCGCGSLDSIVDPAENRTRWERDVQGRVMAKIYPDKTRDTFTYETTTSRLKKVADAKGQVANYSYYLDNALAAVTYTDTAGAPLSPTTLGVTYSYDPLYSRITSMSDGLGTTSYTYNPYSTYVANAPIPASLGAGRLATIDGPLTNDTLGYTYDELGRVLTRSINGAANTTTVHYDTLGRVDTTTNALGTFNLGYVGVTGRLDHVDYPNGQRTNYSYYGNTAPTGTGNGDRRLQQIQNLTPGAANLSTFGYTYDIVGQIKTWSCQNDAASLLTSSFNYDEIGQLLSAVVPASSSAIKNYTYKYDLAGNRTHEQIDSGVTTSVHNNLNQLTGQSPGGAMEFAGTLNEPASVTLAGKPASVDASNNWSGTADVTPGANAILFVATDASGNTTAKTINVTVSGGTARTLSYDIAGNETDNSAGQTYTYDALNRLSTIVQGSNVTEFVYNGVGQRVQEKLNGTLLKQWIWDGGAQPAEERDAAGNVTKRFSGNIGEQVAGTNYYFTTDHLGSVREMTDASGTVHARYEYDPYGRMTKVSGDLESDLGFTSFYRHQASGLYLTLFRAYDPELGRWTSREPLGEMGPDGPGLYWYARNNPISYYDPNGAWAITSVHTPGGALVMAELLGGAIIGGAAYLTLTRPGLIREGFTSCPVGPSQERLPATPQKIIQETIDIVTQPTVHEQFNPTDITLPNRINIQNPPTGVPGSITTIRYPDGTPKQVREYGPDGYPQTDVDWGHGHELGPDGKPVGTPHVHDWTPSPTGGFPQRGPARPPRSGDPQPQ